MKMTQFVTRDPNKKIEGSKGIYYDENIDVIHLFDKNGIEINRQIQPGITGQPGPQGVKGAQGVVGKQGSPGTAGQPGITGSIGQQGSQGNRGQQGAVGKQGAQGSFDDSIITELRNKILELENRISVLENKVYALPHLRIWIDDEEYHSTSNHGYTLVDTIKYDNNEYYLWQWSDRSDDQTYFDDTSDAVCYILTETYNFSIGQVLSNVIILTKDFLLSSYNDYFNVRKHYRIYNIETLDDNEFNSDAVSYQNVLYIDKNFANRCVDEYTGAVDEELDNFINGTDSYNYGKAHKLVATNETLTYNDELYRVWQADTTNASNYNIESLNYYSYALIKINKIFKLGEKINRNDIIILDEDKNLAQYTQYNHDYFADYVIYGINSYSSENLRVIFNNELNITVAFTTESSDGQPPYENTPYEFDHVFKLTSFNTIRYQQDDYYLWEFDAENSYDKYQRLPKYMLTKYLYFEKTNNLEDWYHDNYDVHEMPIFVNEDLNLNEYNSSLVSAIIIVTYYNVSKK